MDDKSLKNILFLLRKIAQHKHKSGDTVASFIAALAGEALSPAATLRIAAYLQDQISEAEQVINNSQLIEEAKAGVHAALRDVKNHFALESMHSGLGDLRGRSSTYIANLVILLNAAGHSIEAVVPDDAADLAKELDEFASRFNSPDLDPVVREIAKKHLALIAMLIRNIPLFGLEAALVAYTELLAKLRRADSQSSEASKSGMMPIMEKMKGWGGRLKALDDAVNAGANLLSRGKAAGGLLQYIPPLG